MLSSGNNATFIGAIVKRGNVGLVGVGMAKYAVLSLDLYEEITELGVLRFTFREKQVQR